MKIKCPSCGFVNVEGEDRCVECFYSLMQRDLPRPQKDDAFQRVVMTTPVSKLLTGKDLLVASKSDSLAKVIEILQKKKKSCLLVYDHKKLVGIISERTILMSVAGKYMDLNALKVADFMTPNPEWIKAEDTVAVAINKMALGGFRHVPVLAKDGVPLSILEIKDVLVYLMKRDHSV